jgi:hypothetical protein
MQLAIYALGRKNQVFLHDLMPTATLSSICKISFKTL